MVLVWGQVSNSEPCSKFLIIDRKMNSISEIVWTLIALTYTTCSTVDCSPLKRQIMRQDKMERNLNILMSKGVFFFFFGGWGAT